MSSIVIRAEGLGKKYRIRHQQRERYTALRDVMTAAIAGIFQDRRSAAAVEEFWAIKDISFEIERGEVLGIIGKNGAGKSTLLKILSRITEPSEGRVELEGRVASLLEVGTGFHPELTGRENIFLNGAILGMAQSEIRRKFDEIVAFAEVENFLDTPVKRYSSGMYVRLAFSVAAHLDSDILIVDEVLAVGDLGFQKKCLNRIRSIGNQQNRTTLFVSHNLEAVRAVCTSACLIEAGRITKRGTVNDTLDSYLLGSNSLEFGPIGQDSIREGTGQAIIESCVLKDDSGSAKRSVYNDEPISVELNCAFYEPLEAGFGILFETLSGERILDVRSCNSWQIRRKFSGRISVTLRISRLNLYPGTYYVTPWIMDWFGLYEDYDVVRRPYQIEVQEREQTTRQKGLGYYVVDQQWNFTPNDY